MAETGKTQVSFTSKNDIESIADTVPGKEWAAARRRPAGSPEGIACEPFPRSGKYCDSGSPSYRSRQYPAGRIPAFPGLPAKDVEGAVEDPGFNAKLIQLAGQAGSAKGWKKKLGGGSGAEIRINQGNSRHTFKFLRLDKGLWEKAIYAHERTLRDKQ